MELHELCWEKLRSNELEPKSHIAHASVLLVFFEHVLLVVQEDADRRDPDTTRVDRHDDTARVFL